MLSKIVENIGKRKMKKYLGKVVEAIVTERGFRKGSLVARLRNYVPVVISEERDLLGKRVLVKITDYSFYDVRGVTLDGEKR